MNARRTVRTRRRDESGIAALEAVVLAVPLSMLLALVVLGGRVGIASQAVEQAAYEAAREASIARTPGQARLEAVAAADAVLAQQSLRCTSVQVVLDTSGFAVPVGQPAQVRATVTCPLPLSDLNLPLPGTRTVTSSAVSALDTYRER